jgi:MYXO-CTERM domain-containing protein
VQSTLPEGLTLSRSGDNAGVISGTPVRFGGYPLEIEVESRGLVHRKRLQLDVADSPLELTIVTPDLPAGTLSLDYDIALAAAGGQPNYTWSVSGGRLPPGLDIGTDGVISGVPLKDGEFTIEITVKDANGTVVVREFTITVEAPNVVILTGRVPTLPLLEAVDFQVIASGGQEPYGWTALSDPPPGLRLTEDGRLEGTPSQVGRFALRVQVTDSSEAESQDTGLLQVEIADVGPFEIITQRLDPGPVRVEFVREIRVEGGVEPIEWSFAPGNGLPSDFTLETAGRTATIRGNSVRSVAHGFTLRAEDAAGRQREGTFAIRIDQFTAPPVAAGCSATETSGSSLLLLFGLLVLGFLRRLSRRA